LFKGRGTPLGSKRAQGQGHGTLLKMPSRSTSISSADTETNMSSITIKQNLESGDSTSDTSTTTSILNDENTNRNNFFTEIATDLRIQSESDETKLSRFLENNCPVSSISHPHHYQFKRF
jgi:hypothetical protein